MVKPPSSCKQVPGYEVLCEIGAGTYGKVYKVREVLCGDVGGGGASGSGRELVLKQVRLDGLSAQEQEETTREAHLMLNIDEHANIVKHYVSFIEEGYLNMVMEYCAGGDLAKLIRETAGRGELFSETFIWRVFVQVCLALQHLHANRVLHRDIKPDNVFLDAEGRVKVGDLGLGRLMSSQTRHARSTVGTPLYFSPELCKEDSYDERSDVWALGCLVYQMAALRPPFVAKSPIALAHKIVNAPPKPLPPRYSSDLHFVVHRMLEKEARDRPNVAQLLNYGPTKIHLMEDRMVEWEKQLLAQCARREEDLLAQLARRDLDLEALRRTREEDLEALRHARDDRLAALRRADAADARAEELEAKTLELQAALLVLEARHLQRSHCSNDGAAAGGYATPHKRSPLRPPSSVKLPNLAAAPRSARILAAATTIAADTIALAVSEAEATTTTTAPAHTHTHSHTPLAGTTATTRTTTMSPTACKPGAGAARQLLRVAAAEGSWALKMRHGRRISPRAGKQRSPRGLQDDNKENAAPAAVAATVAAATAKAKRSPKGGDGAARAAAQAQQQHPSKRAGALFASPAAPSAPSPLRPLGPARRVPSAMLLASDDTR